MSDVRLSWDETEMGGVITYDTATNDLMPDDGLTTAVLISLFTDALAKEDDELPNELFPDDFPDRRGWWADSTSQRANDSVGSRLWLLERSKVTTENLRRAEQYAREALQWMVDEGLASKITVVTEQGGAGLNQLFLQVSISKYVGEARAFRFELLWEGTVS